MVGQRFTKLLQVLDAALSKFNIVAADIFCNHGSIASSKGQHVISHIHPDAPAFGANYLRGDETYFSCAAAQVQDCFI